MYGLVVYESKFGNTQRVAEIIGRALGSYGSARVVHVESPQALTPDNVDLLVIGGPTQAHGMSPGMRAYLEATLGGVAPGMAAPFDTRLKGPGFLWGSAAKAIGDQLRRAGFQLVAPPASFLVEGMKEPRLVDGEAERAEAWAIEIGTHAVALDPVAI